MEPLALRVARRIITETRNVIVPVCANRHRALAAEIGKSDGRSLIPNENFSFSCPSTVPPASCPRVPLLLSFTPSNIERSAVNLALPPRLPTPALPPLPEPILPKGRSFTQSALYEDP